MFLIIFFHCSYHELNYFAYLVKSFVETELFSKNDSYFSHYSLKVYIPYKIYSKYS